MKSKLLLTCLAGLLAYGCINTEKEKGNSQVKQKNTAKTMNEPVAYPSSSDTLCVDIRNDGTGYLKVRKKERQQVILLFNSQDFTKMEAHLPSWDSTANIRFAQVVIPSGNTDGPFDATLSRDLPAKGNYLLFVHENQIADNPWSGDFEINISLSK